jgi:hypothetical protein
VRDGICADHTAAIELIYRAFMLEDASDAVLGKVGFTGARSSPSARATCAMRATTRRCGG